MKPSQLLEQAIGLQRGGALDEAEQLCLQILAVDPRHVGARQMLGNLCMQQGRFDEALTEYDAALAVDPRAIEALMQKGFALQALEQIDAALAHYDHILSLEARFPPALYFRGNLLFMLGRAEEALQSFDRALAIHAPFAEAWLSRGVVLHRLRRGMEAIAAYDRAIAIRPNYPEAWFNRGSALEDMMRLEDALASYDRAITFRPDYAKAHNNRGIVLIGLRRYNDAAQAYEKTLAIDPEQVFALGGLAAAALYACDWEKVASLKDAVERDVMETRSAISPGTILGYSDDPSLLQQCAATFADNAVGATPPPLWRGEIFRNPKIRVAYLSADFHEHATAHLIAELFERHDRERFEIWGIGFDADDGSALRQRLIRSFDRFEDVSTRSDREVAEFLHREKIDIAVDLKGFTLNARTGIFAHRPAPLQVNYLGYPGTMGVDYFDYILGDQFVTPLDQAPFYNEKIAQLPDCYQPNDATRKLDLPMPSRTQAGLPEQGFVFCCFNNNWKITAPVFVVWMRLLAAVPGSVLWLLEDSKDAAANLRRHAATAGIAPERLIFAPRLDVELHLSRHRLADLFLDTLPYNAHTTASDALRLGVPLVTVTGRAFAGRVATSLLHAVGLPELAADNLQDYERIALDMAQGRLAEVRRKLTANLATAPLFDGERYRRGIEAAYQTMWQTWQAGKAPESFAVPTP